MVPVPLVAVVAGNVRAVWKVVAMTGSALNAMLAWTIMV